MDNSVEHKLILGDCLSVMDKLLINTRGEIDCVYIDPPFFTGRQQVSHGNSFSDAWNSIDDYIKWLTPRLERMRLLLKSTGSLFVHLDWHAVHYVKVALDEIFGINQFRNEILWHYGSGGRSRRHFPRKHDMILWYSRSNKYQFYPDAIGIPRNLCTMCGRHRDKWNNLKAQKDDDGRIFRTIKSAGRIYRYYDDEPVLPPDVWLDISHLQQKDPERVGYPTQKPEALLVRIIKATTKPGDTVADFFCGSGTTLAAAAELERSSIGCDVSSDAIEVTKQRLERMGKIYAVNFLESMTGGFDVAKI
jgi:site-specific DNA-methyltransferase (adenine-specific)/adenine-specific DNA-methyltransferase